MLAIILFTLFSANIHASQPNDLIEQECNKKGAVECLFSKGCKIAKKDNSNRLKCSKNPAIITIDDIKFNNWNSRERYLGKMFDKKPYNFEDSGYGSYSGKNQTWQFFSSQQNQDRIQNFDYGVLTNIGSYIFSSKKSKEKSQYNYISRSHKKMFYDSKISSAFYQKWCSVIADTDTPNYDKDKNNQQKHSKDIKYYNWPNDKKGRTFRYEETLYFAMELPKTLITCFTGVTETEALAFKKTRVYYTTNNAAINSYKEYFNEIGKADYPTGCFCDQDDYTKSCGPYAHITCSIEKQNSNNKTEKMEVSFQDFIELKRALFNTEFDNPIFEKLLGRKLTKEEKTDYADIIKKMNTTSKMQTIDGIYTNN